MGNRYGRNQKRRARAEIESLKQRDNYQRVQLERMHERLRPIIAMEYLLDRIAGQLGPEMRPYLERLMESDSRRCVPLAVSSARLMVEDVEVMRATFELRAEIRL